MIVNSESTRKVRQNDIEIANQKETEEREKAKKDNNFVKIFRDAMPELRWLSLNHSKAYAIFMFIVEHMDFQNALMCSQQVFIDYFDISRPTVARAIKVLKDNGFVDILKSGTSNVYIINHEVAWSSWSNQKQYSKFQGNILISKKENKDYEYKSQFEKFKALKERENLK